MSLSYSSERSWHHMATVEVACDVVDFAQLIQDDVLEFQIEPAGKSPPGVRWFLFFVDLSKGERRAARTAWAVLTALQRSADAGCIAGFRVVDGQRWLALETTIITGEGETSRHVLATAAQGWRNGSEATAGCVGQSLCRR